MLSTLRIAIGFALWGTVVASFTPDFAFAPLRVFHRFLSVSTRRTSLLVWHMCATGLAASAATAIAASYFKQTRSQNEGIHEFLCQEDAKLNAFSNSKLVASVTLALFLLYARMFIDRCVAVFAGARSSGIFSRVSRAIDTGSLIWLSADASPLAVPLSFILMLDWGTLRMADIMSMKNMKNAHKMKLAHKSVSLFGACALAHWGGESFVETCPSAKNNASVVVVHAMLWAFSLGRSLLQYALQGV